MKPNKEKVDILTPPMFQKSGITKSITNAWRDGDWVGTFNLWVFQTLPQPAIVYQQRSSLVTWSPGKLGVAAGGHYQSNEGIIDGLREVKEEIGKKYAFNKLIYCGKRLYVGFDSKNRKRQNVVDIFMVLDNSKIESYKLQKSEVDKICICPIKELIKIYKKDNYRFKVQAMTNQGKLVEIIVDKNSFPLNWDNYHQKMVFLIDKFLKQNSKICY